MNPIKLKLLEHLSKQTDYSNFLKSDSTDEKRSALIEMEKESLIECKYRTDETGKPSDFFMIFITSYGRKVLSEIQNPPKKETNWTMIGVVCALAGLVVTVILGFLEIKGIL